MWLRFMTSGASCARAACLIVPSIWHETFGLVVAVVAEAVAWGRGRRGSIGRASRARGARAYSVQFRPGDSDDLARQVAWISDHPTEAAVMREPTRAEYQSRYSVDPITRCYAAAMPVPLRPRRPGRRGTNDACRLTEERRQDRPGETMPRAWFQERARWTVCQDRNEPSIERAGVRFQGVGPELSISH
jgi:hypothetical protein